MARSLSTVRPRRSSSSQAARTRASGLDFLAFGSGSTAEIAALIGAQCWHELKAPVARLGTEVVPMPFARSLEKAAVPDEAAIVAALRGLMGR